VSQVVIERIEEKNDGGGGVFLEIEGLTQRIRERAFELYENRDRGAGRELEDWVNAEREYLVQPEAELIEHEARYEIRVRAPGFEQSDVVVSVLPKGLIVRAAAVHNHHRSDGEVRFSEFGEKVLLRRFDFGEEIDRMKVTANLNRGVLHVRAMKAKDAGKAQGAIA